MVLTLLSPLSHYRTLPASLCSSTLLRLNPTPLYPVPPLNGSLCLYSLLIQQLFARHAFVFFLSTPLPCSTSPHPFLAPCIRFISLPCPVSPVMPVPLASPATVNYSSYICLLSRLSTLSQHFSFHFFSCFYFVPLLVLF